MAPSQDESMPVGPLPTLNETYTVEGSQSKQAAEKILPSRDEPMPVPPPPVSTCDDKMDVVEESGPGPRSGSSEKSSKPSLADLFEEEMEEDADVVPNRCDAGREAEPVVPETQEIAPSYRSQMDTSVYTETPLTQQQSVNDQEVYPELKNRTEPVVDLIPFLTTSTW
jgi:hypothetical protein